MDRQYYTRCRPRFLLWNLAIDCNCIFHQNKVHRIEDYQGLVSLVDWNRVSGVINIKTSRLVTVYPEEHSAKHGVKWSKKSRKVKYQTVASYRMFGSDSHNPVTIIYQFLLIIYHKTDFKPSITFNLTLIPPNMQT